MVEGIVIGVVIGVVMLVINSLVHRSGIQTRTDRLEEKIDRLEEGHKVTMQVLLPLVLSVKGEKPNGELERALYLLNDYLIKK